MPYDNSDAAKLLYDTIKATTNAFVNSYENAGADITLLSSTLAPACRRHIAPASFLKMLGVPAGEGQSNTEYEAQMAQELSLLQKMHVETKHLSIDVQQRVSTVWVHNYFTIPGKEETFMEFLFILSFDVHGEKIEKIVEFLDTAEVFKLMNAVKQASESVG